MRILTVTLLLATSGTIALAQQPAATPADTSSQPSSQTPAATPTPAAGQTTPDAKPTDSKSPDATPTDGRKELSVKDAPPATNKEDSIPSPGEQRDPHIKKGTEEDVDAVGQRNIGGRGMGNWYSTNWEIGTGKQYSMEIEKSSHLVTDPVVVEYVNRVGQNLVKNSDSKVPFTIKVLDTDEINAMALPGGFF